MTLGPKFHRNLRSTITRRRKHLFAHKKIPIWSARRDLYFYSIKPDLKHYGIFYLIFEKLHATLDSQVPVFLRFLSPEGD